MFSFLAYLPVVVLSENADIFVKFGAFKRRLFERGHWAKFLYWQVTEVLWMADLFRPSGTS